MGEQMSKRYRMRLHDWKISWVVTKAEVTETPRTIFST